MGEVFFKLFNMSLTAVWMIAAVLILRPLLKRYSSMLCMAAWGFVGLRLLCPFTLESVLSLIPSDEPVPMSIITAAMPQIDSGLPVVNEAVDQVLGTNFAPEVGASVNPLQVIAAIATVVWLLGIATMIVYGVIGMIGVHKRMRTAVPLEKGVWIGDDIGTPFVMGVFRPRIYLPSALPEEDRVWVIAHERSHIRWGDAAWKLLGFIALTVHWFNPFVWLAYFMFCRDLESACDERVVNDKTLEERKAYSSALVRCSASHRLTLAPLAFGEVNVKTRVRAVLNFKKPAIWIAIAACVLLGASVLFWFCDPVSAVDSMLDYAIGGWVLEHHEGEYTPGSVAVEHHEVLGIKEKSDRTEVYMWVLYEEYVREDGELKSVSGAHIPTVITAEKQIDGSYILQEYWEAEDGSRHVPSIRDRFPMRLWRKATDSQEYIDKQTARCRMQAEHMLPVDPLEGHEDAQWLLATVKEVRGDTVLVEGLEGQPVEGEITFSAESVNSILPEGEIVKIYYDGTAQETYPVQLPTVYKVERYQPEDALADCYSVAMEGDGSYYYSVFALDGRELDFRNNIPNEPKVYSPRPDDYILCALMTYGNHVTDMKTVYYDLKTGAVSEEFTGLVWVRDSLVYHSVYENGEHRFVIQGMFPYSSWYESFVLEDAASSYPVLTAEVQPSGCAEVTYRTEDGATKTVMLGQGVHPPLYATVTDVQEQHIEVLLTEGQGFSGRIRIGQDMVSGDAQVGDTVVIHYNGYLLTTDPMQLPAGSVVEVMKERNP